MYRSSSNDDDEDDGGGEEEGNDDIDNRDDGGMKLRMRGCEWEMEGELSYVSDRTLGEKE